MGEVVEYGEAAINAISTIAVVGELTASAAKAGISLAKKIKLKPGVIIKDGIASYADDAARVKIKGAIKTGQLSGSLNGLTSTERTVVNDLLSQGKNVEIIPTTTASKTPDFLVNGVKTELKSLKNPNINTGITRIQKGFKQGAETVIIDGRQAGLTTDQANQILNRASGTYQNKTLPGQVEIWTNDGVIRR